MASGTDSAVTPLLAAAGPRPGDDTEFVWNTRACTGNKLHKAVLDGRKAEVVRLLDQDPSLLTATFRYLTVSNGKTEESFGLPIHLAVTRPSVDILKLLINRGAAVNSMVVRDGRDHYDVLHAAVSCEGRGGAINVIRCLLESKAEHTQNQDGQYPLHLAFQCGIRSLISVLSEDMRRRGVPEPYVDLEGKTPLQIGIKHGNLSPQALAEVAPLDRASMAVFLHEYPQSLEFFLKRISPQASQGEDDRDDVDVKGALAQYVTLEDVCKCLQRHPAAAAVLLDALTTEPEVENKAWHPLPKRMSLGPRNRVEQVRAVLNPQRQFYSTYQPACRWEYYDGTAEAPRWHQLVLMDAGRPHRDVDMQVCQLPEIVCIDFLWALQDAEYPDIFNNAVVRAVLDSVWWHGAYRLDVLQFFTTLCGLALLIVERCMQERALARTPEDDSADRQVFTLLVVHRFIGARGIFDLLHQVLLVAANGRRSDYLNAKMLVLFLRACLAVWFYFCDQSAAYQVVLILIYWAQLIDVTFSEKLMRELLPITRLAAGLAPSCVVCLIAVCAFTHAHWVMASRPLWPKTFYESFSLLFAYALPDVEGTPTWTLIFAYFQISVFSVFFLNIFISVISENYSDVKANVEVTLQAKRAHICHFFLLKAHLLPCRLMSHAAMQVTFWLAGALAAGALWYYFTVPPERHSEWFALLFVLAQVLALLACCQDPAHAWSPQKAPAAPRYMWIATIKQPDPPPTYGLQDLREDILKEVKAMLADGRKHDVGHPPQPVGDQLR